MVRLSVVIANYGPVDIVAPCLESLKEDHRQGLIEVIVVDNHTPGFPVENFRRDFPWIRLVVRDCNRGFAVGSNAGIRMSTGEFVLLLNPDTRVRPGTLRTMVDFLEHAPEVGAATCRVELPDGSLDPASHRGFPTPWASLTYFLGLERLLPRSRIFSQYHLGWRMGNAIHEIDSPSGCFFLVRRPAIEQVGLLDEEYFLYGEDLDWAMRIKRAGWKICYNPAVAIVHLKGTTSGIKSATSASCVSSPEARERAFKAFYDAMRIFYRKHYRRGSPLANWLVLAAIGFREWAGRRKMHV